MGRANNFQHPLYIYSSIDFLNYHYRIVFWCCFVSFIHSLFLYLFICVCLSFYSSLLFCSPKKKLNANSTLYVGMQLSYRSSMRHFGLFEVRCNVSSHFVNPWLHFCSPSFCSLKAIYLHFWNATFCVGFLFFTYLPLFLFSISFPVIRNINPIFSTSFGVQCLVFSVFWWYSNSVFMH